MLLDFIYTTYLSNDVKIVDLIIIGIIAWGGYKGYNKGFLMEFLSVVAFFTAILVVFKAIQEGFIYSGNLPKEVKAIPALTYSVMFALICVFINLIGRKLKGKIEYTLFDDFDEIAGMVLGLAKYAAFLAIFVEILNDLGLDFVEKKGFYAYPLLKEYFGWLIYVGDFIVPYTSELREQIHEILSNGVPPNNNYDSIAPQ